MTEEEIAVNWSEFPVECHYGTNQLKRIRSAVPLAKKCENVDPEKRTCILRGTSSVPYSVSSESCTCADFDLNYREVPCKHMYALMIRLGLFDPAPYLAELERIAPEFEQQKWIHIDPFACWDAAFDAHSTAAFKEARGKSKKFSLVILNRKTQSGTFSSERHYYHTTLETCDCGITPESAAPCKHIYRLALRLGVLDQDGRKQE